VINAAALPGTNGAGANRETEKERTC